MNKWEYHFDVPLDSSIQAKLDALGLVPGFLKSAAAPGYEKDAFTPDGYPVDEFPSTVYPSLLYKTIGIPISENVTLVDPLFRQKAALAGLKWAEKVFAKQEVRWNFSGIYFNEWVHGEEVNFCFPVTSMLINVECNVFHCAVMVFPESHHDDDNWEDGMIPQYAMMQAQLTMWCSQQYAAQHDSDFFPVDSAILVRLTGNLSVDTTIRTVDYDPKQANRILQRIAKAVKTCKASGKGYHENLVTLPTRDWKEEKQQDLEDAFCIDSEPFYDLVQQYMAVRSNRKRLEEEQDALKQQMDNIAIRLASRLDPQYDGGSFETAGTVYSVSHKKRAVNPAKVTAGLVRQLAPQHIDTIHTNVIPRGRISIEVL